MLIMVPLITSFLSALTTAVYAPFHIQVKVKFGKNIVYFCSHQGLNPQLLNYQVKCTTKSTNTYFVIIPIILGLHYHYSHLSITFK